jgi:hypothetical protein
VDGTGGGDRYGASTVGGKPALGAEGNITLIPEDKTRGFPVLGVRGWSRLIDKARQRAYRRLAKQHPHEFEGVYRMEIDRARREAGLSDGSRDDDATPVRTT